MKKYLTSPPYKLRNKRHATRLLQRNLLYKLYKKERLTKEQGLSFKERKIQRSVANHKKKDYDPIKAPADFSFINNPTKIIKFINQLDKHFLARKKVYIVLSAVENIDYDALVVLLSIMVKFKVNGISFNGGFSKNIEVNKIILESGFFDYVLLPIHKRAIYELYGKKSFYTHSNLNVDPELTAEIIEEYSKYLWKSKRRCPGAQRALIELMQNTNNHASRDREGEKHWWLSVNYSEKDSKVCFSFVDYGIGIFNSLDNKVPGDKFYDWANYLSRYFPFEDNSDILRLIMQGELHKTVTEQSHRGRGLPGIYQVIERNQISNLHIITNNVFASVSKNVYKILPSSFNGTFVYFELEKGNGSLNGSN